MNSVNLIGRITRDPEIRYTQDQKAVAMFSIAIDRGKNKNGDDLGADFPNIKCFGKTAELIEKYMAKGRLIGISGRIQTGKYENKEGQTVYTTEVVAERVTFVDKPAKAEPDQPAEVPKGFSQINEDDIPF